MTERVQVTVKDNPADSRYEALDAAGTVVGFTRYERRGGNLVLMHTEVDDAFEGQGVGSTLVRGTLDDLQAAGQPVVVECPFVRKYIENHPEYQGVLDNA